MDNKPPAPSRGRALWFSLGALGLALLVLAYLAATWRSLPRFQAAIDSCARLFCDFTTFYYPMGRAILHTSTPVKGFMYSPFVALLLALFSPLATNSAVAVWGIVQAASVVLYLCLFRWLVPAGLRYQMLFVLIALTSFPLWHTLSWGQVGIITTVTVLGMLALLERGHRLTAAALAGLAASFKFFPLIFLAPFASRRDFRFLLLAALACLACLVVIPGILMGPNGTLTFYRGLLDSYRASEWVVGNYNSQHFPHILLRLFSRLGFTARPYLPLLSIVSFSLAALNLALVYLVQRARLPYPDLWSVHLLFLSIPFFLKTSWPVDLVYISFAQALLVWQTLEGEPLQPGAQPKRLTQGVLLTLVVISIGLSNMATFDLVGSYGAFGFIGFIFWADLLCLIASYVLLLPLINCRLCGIVSSMKSPYLGLTLLLLFSLVLTACSRVEPQQTPPPPATPLPATATATRPATAAPSPTPVVVHGTLSIRHSWSESELPALVQIVDGFRLKYPEVYFDVLYVPAQDLRTRFETETRAGNGPTLLLGPAEWGPPLYEEGLVADLSPLLDEEQLATLNAPAVAANRAREALAGAPYSMQGVVLFRNEEVVTISPTTLDEMIALASTTQQGETLGAVLERSPFYSAAHLEGIGGHLMDENGNPAFNSPAGLEWIDLLRQFEAAGPPNYFSDDDLARFKEGSVGWIIDGTWNLRPLAAAIGPENLIIDPWPGARNGRLSGYVIPDNIYLSAQASPEQRLAAQAFIEYLLSPEAQAVLAEAGRIPTASSVTLTDPVMGRLVKEAMAAMANGVPYPNTPAMSLYTLNLDLALRDIFTQNTPPEQALQAADDAIRAGLAGEITPTPTP